MCQNFKIHAYLLGDYYKFGYKKDLKSFHFREQSGG